MVVNFQESLQNGSNYDDIVLKLRKDLDTKVWFLIFISSTVFLKEKQTFFW